MRPELLKPDFSGALALQALDALLEDMSGPNNGTVWDVSALKFSTRWAEARVKAQEVLFAIH